MDWQAIDDTVSAWIRSSGINPIMLGWAICMVLLALWREWRGK